MQKTVNLYWQIKALSINYWLIRYPRIVLACYSLRYNGGKTKWIPNTRMVTLDNILQTDGGNG